MSQVTECAPKSSKHWTSDEHLTLQKLAGTMTAEQIAQVIGKPIRSVYNHAARNSIVLRLKGQANPQAKYPNIIVAACRELFTQGHSPFDIAREYGFPLRVVQNWCYKNDRFAGE